MRVIPDEVFAALTIRAEAEGEPHAGKVAIGEVIRERMRQRFFSDGTVMGTCFLRLQFSIWNDDKQDNLRAVAMLKTEYEDPAFRECVKAWIESENTKIVPSAVQYYNPHVVMPSWLDDFTLVAKIGNHDFLKRKRLL